MQKGTNLFGIVMLALAVALGCVAIAVMFGGATKGFAEIALIELVVLIIICTGVILKKLDNIGHKDDEEDKEK